MLLIAHQTDEDAIASAQELRALGAQARGLLGECVEHQGVTRKVLSAAARALEDASFVYVRDTGNIWSGQFTITPTLAGEEALETLERLLASKER